MKFGYYVRFNVYNYSEIRDLTLKVERLGFDSIHVNDHLIGFDETQDKREPYLEAVMLLTALAVETHNVKLGNIVLCNSYRNPAYLAKMISTLDHISNGRALMWIGAGWYQEEYNAYGYQFPTPKRRVDELEESLTIYKKLFTEDVTNFEGKFWKLKRNRNYPKPFQKPYPQIVLGTSGKRMFEIACREADGINIPFPNSQQKNIELLLDSISNINEMLKKYNRDPSKFEISLFNRITIANSQEEVNNIRRQKKILKKDLRNHFIGLPEDIREKITEFEDMGVNKMIIANEKTELEDSLEVFSKEVM